VTDPNTFRLAATLGGVGQQADATGIRIGVVTAFNSGDITVRISGSDTLVNAAYLRSYDPALGDRVVVIREGAVWVVLGSYTHDLIDGDPIKNPSFERGVLSQTIAPEDWTNYNSFADAGTTTKIGHVNFNGFGVTANAVDGANVLYISGSKAGTGEMQTENYVQSSQIEVQPGERWGASCYAYMTASPTSATDTVFAAAAILFLYFDPLGNDFMPNNIGNSTFLGGVINREQWQFITIPGGQGGVTIPPNVARMRVAVYSLLLSNSNVATPLLQMFFDRVNVRKIADAPPEANKVG
jgi:hypothetical protein